MSDELRERLHEEMAGQARPPLRGVVSGAVAQGTTIRRRRRLASGAGTTAVVGAVAAVVALSGQFAPGHSASVNGAAGSAPTSVAAVKAAPAKKPVAVSKPAAVAAATTAAATSAAATTTSAAATTTSAPAAVANLQPKLDALRAKMRAEELAGKSISADKQRYAALEGAAKNGAVKSPTALPPGVPATATGMLQLLTSLLPAGSTSNAGVVDDGTTGVELNVATPSGPAMVRVFLDRSPDVPAGCGAQTGCTVLPNGDIVEVGGLDDNCIQTKYVTVIHPDGSTVMVNLSTCLEWNGSTNPASPLAMTLDQATTIAENPGWDLSMDPALVAAGAAAFPTPHQFG